MSKLLHVTANNGECKQSHPARMKNDWMFLEFLSPSEDNKEEVAFKDYVPG